MAPILPVSPRLRRAVFYTASAEDTTDLERIIVSELEVEDVVVGTLAL